MKLTHERLLSFLHYDPETGIFTNRKKRTPVGAMGRDGLVIKIDRVNYIAHRLASFYITGAYPTVGINHKDGDFRNNRLSHLRQLTAAEKRFNCGVSSVYPS